MSNEIDWNDDEQEQRQADTWDTNDAVDAAMTDVPENGPEDDDEQERGLALRDERPIVLSDDDVIGPDEAGPTTPEYTIYDPMAGSPGLPPAGGMSADDLLGIGSDNGGASQGAPGRTGEQVQVQVHNGVIRLGDRVTYRGQVGTAVQFQWVSRGRPRWRVVIDFDAASNRPGYRNTVDAERVFVGDAEAASGVHTAPDHWPQREPEPEQMELPDMPPGRFDWNAWGQPVEAERKAKTPYKVPQDAEFGQGSDRVDVMDANDLERISAELIDQHSGLLGSLNTLTIAYYWKRKGGSVDAIAQKVDSFLQKETGGAQIKVWFAADALRAQQATLLDVERLMFQCLVSIDAAAPSTMQPDVKLYIPVLLKYGPCTPELRVLERIFRRRFIDEQEAEARADADAGRAAV